MAKEITFRRFESTRRDSSWSVSSDEQVEAITFTSSKRLDLTGISVSTTHPEKSLDAVIKSYSIRRGPSTGSPKVYDHGLSITLPTTEEVEEVRIDHHDRVAIDKDTSYTLRLHYQNGCSLHRRSRATEPAIIENCELHFEIAQTGKSDSLNGTHTVHGPILCLHFYIMDGWERRKAYLFALKSIDIGLTKTL